MSLFCVHRLCRPCQFWTRWRMCIIVIVLSQSVLLLLFSDIIQKKSPRAAALDHSLINTPFTRRGPIGSIGNSSIQVEGRLTSSENGPTRRLVHDGTSGAISLMQSYNDNNESNFVKFKIPKRKSRLKYEVPEAKLKKINVVELKQTLDLLSQKAEQSISEMKQQTPYGNKGDWGNNEEPSRDVISSAQSQNGKAPANKKDKSKRKYVEMGRGREDSNAIDVSAKNYRDTATVTMDGVDKVKGDQYNGGYVGDRWGKFNVVNHKDEDKANRLLSDKQQQQLQKQQQQKQGLKWEGSETKLGKTQDISRGTKVSISLGSRLTTVLMQIPGDRKQPSVVRDGAHLRSSKGVLPRSSKGQLNPGSNSISGVATEPKASRSDLEQHTKVNGHNKISLAGLAAPSGLNRSTAQGLKSSLHTDFTGRINVNKDKLTAGPPRESAPKKLANGLKRAINSPISIRLAKAKSTIRHGPLHIAVNMSKLAGQNFSDIMPNVTLTEALAYEYPPRISVPNFFHFKDLESSQPYFKSIGRNNCFIEGTDESFAHNNKSRHCHCKQGFYGKHCSIPGFVYFTAGSRYVQSIRPRNKTRRIINALTFNMEYELLEARINDLWDVVDVFLILESNYSYHGDPKPLHLWESLRNGFLKKFHSKIMYFFLDHFPENGKQDGWLADRYPRQYIGQVGLRHILGTHPDDLFIYTDTDEIPSRDALLFLRLHDGYPEPFGFTLRWSVYGFFWQQFEPTRVWAGCTLAMLRLVFNWDVYSLRSGSYWNTHQASVATYVRAGGQVSDWHLGGVAAADGSLQYTGWHCSWCLPPDRIRTKLTSAINADFPRWGDFPEKLDLDYIRGLIRSGTWFDDVTKIGELSEVDDEFYAPSYLLDYPQKFKALLDLNEALKV